MKKIYNVLNMGKWAVLFCMSLVFFSVPSAAADKRITGEVNSYTNKYIVVNKWRYYYCTDKNSIIKNHKGALILNSLGQSTVFGALEQARKVQLKIKEGKKCVNEVQILEFKE